MLALNDIWMVERGTGGGRSEHGRGLGHQGSQKGMMEWTQVVTNYQAPVENCTESGF
jgi:hypothetical protein